jgi:DNA replication and repair protein RecF
MRALAVEWLQVRDFRNLTNVEIALGPGLNVLSGDNGQGKTNLLEAVYVLATSRSFRTAKIPELVQTGSEAASVRARVVEGGDGREQSVGLKAGQRLVRIDGKRPNGLAAYAVRTPVVVFHPGAVALSGGGGSERRKLLDRIALYRGPASLADATAFARAMRARQRVLETRGESARDLEQWEELVVRHGMAVTQARAAAAAELCPAAERAFARIGPEGARLTSAYRPGAPVDADKFRSALASGRARDRVRRSAGVGPHRDDLVLELAGRSVRGMASQGQHRAVVLSLELAEMEVIADARGVRPLLLLDDVSSELDRGRTEALLSALRREEGQVLLTTTRPELIGSAFSGLETRRDFAVVRGQIQPA